MSTVLGGGTASSQSAAASAARVQANTCWAAFPAHSPPRCLAWDQGGKHIQRGGKHIPDATEVLLSLGSSCRPMSQARWPSAGTAPRVAWTLLRKPSHLMNLRSLCTLGQNFQHLGSAALLGEHSSYGRRAFEGSLILLFSDKPPSAHPPRGSGGTSQITPRCPAATACPGPSPPTQGSTRAQRQVGSRIRDPPIQTPWVVSGTPSPQPGVTPIRRGHREKFWDRLGGSLPGVWG